MQIRYTVNYRISKVILTDGEDIKNLTEDYRRNRNMSTVGTPCEDYVSEIINYVERKIRDKTLLPGTSRDVSIRHGGKRYIASVDVWAM